MFAEHDPGSVDWVMFAGQVIVGGALSTTLKVVVTTVVFPEVSLTVIVTVYEPTPTSVSAAGLCVISRFARGVQLSEATRFVMKFGTSTLSQVELTLAVTGAGAVTVGGTFSVTFTD